MTSLHVWTCMHELNINQISICIITSCCKNFHSHKFYRPARLLKKCFVDSQKQTCEWRGLNSTETLWRYTLHSHTLHTHTLHTHTLHRSSKCAQIHTKISVTTWISLYICIAKFDSWWAARICRSFHESQASVLALLCESDMTPKYYLGGLHVLYPLRTNKKKQTLFFSLKWSIT